ncbi:MAG TPA: glycine zipper 2TM domain-containing protein [Telluria sp.]
MKVRKALYTAMFAMVPMSTMMLAVAPVQAQPMQYSRDASPVIRGFNVDEVRRITPGAELNFDVYGTPGGRAVLRIDGATRNLQMTETDPGVYQGTYTIGTRDRISASSAVTANLRVGNRVTSEVLAESVLRGGVRREARQDARDDARRGDLAVIPKVNRFDVKGNDDLDAGSELEFTVHGTPNAKVSLAIAGARGVFFLPEVRPGEYSGTYTIRRADRILPNSPVTATIVSNGRSTTSTLGRPLLIAGAAPRPVQRAARYCDTCATVEQVNVVEVSGSGNYLGTVGGAVVGGLLGNQVGGGNGRTAAQIAGAVGGAVIGNNIERNSRRNKNHYEVVVRYGNGGTQTIVYETDPGYRTGDKVRVNNGVLVRD